MKINDNPYEFNLILRGSRDGFETIVFWNLCNQKKNVVIKVKDADEIIGGYNPIGWNSNLDGLNSQYSETNDIPSKAIYNYNCFTIAACFGNDLFMDGNQSFWITNNYGYEN
ncbi:hypothetical protein Glove_13g274 [Diversispora epigaea]|uniref:TLDc domain-containing protein n=1 Tax=Diversispora epigaea TaxID=1348612 RepID=A0A397JMA9_9GLOM|nr:hypothetical protein Glove_13g274 [Diversispora epigaea]